MGRHCYSRPHTKEERKKSKKNRWKRKIAAEERRLVDLVKTEVVRQLRQEDKTAVASHQCATKVQAQTTRPLQEDKAAEAPKMPNLSRAAKMVEAAKKKKVPKGALNFLQASKQQAQTTRRHADGKRSSVRQINPDRLDSRKEYIARGTYGKCYLTKHRGMPVLTKEVKSFALAHQEAEVLEALPDHRSLPYLFGIRPSSEEPSFLVMQFHGKKGRALT